MLAAHFSASLPRDVSRIRGALDRFLSARSRRVLLLLAAVWIINGFDLVFTLLAERDGILHEQNPIARALLPHGELVVALFKVSLVAGASVLLWRCRAHRCTELAAILAVLVYACVALQWKACYDTFDLTFTGDVEGIENAMAYVWELPLPGRR